MGEGFDFDIIHEVSDSDIVEEDQHDNNAQCEINFHKVASIENIVIEEAADSDKDEQPLNLNQKKEVNEEITKLKSWK